MIKQFINHLYLKIKWHRKLWLHPTAGVSLKSTFEGGNKIHARTVFDGHLGFCSYIAPDCQIYGKIGRFVSIAPFCRFTAGMHPYTYPSATTSPVFFSLMKQCGFTYADRQMADEFRWADPEKKYAVVVGNDCWLQTNVTVMSGVTIGDGAVVLAGAIVTKDVPPYAIVGGIPARILKYRYDPDDIDFLLSFRWWERGERWWKENWRLLSSIDDLKKYAETHKTDTTK